MIRGEKQAAPLMIGVNTLFDLKRDFQLLTAQLSFRNAHCVSLSLLFSRLISKPNAQFHAHSLVAFCVSLFF